MTDLSREELRAHLSAVEAQVRAALRIIAAESKSVQQAHSALRADLSAALIRLQSDINTGSGEIDAKLERALAEIDNLGRQRRLTTAILTTLVLMFGITVGLLAGGSWYFLQQTSEMRAATVSAPPAVSQQAPEQESAARDSPANGQSPASQPFAPARPQDTRPAPSGGNDDGGFILGTQ